MLKRVVIIGDGCFPRKEYPRYLISTADIIVCCDGAFRKYMRHCKDIFGKERLPDAVIGDMDSLSENMKRKYQDIIIRIDEQEHNDQTKAVKFLRSKGVTRIAIVGATGKREDHTMGNISLLAEYQRWGLDVRIYTDYGVFVACSGTQRMACRKGQAVSIFNISARNLSSEGLQYPIYDFSQLWQGTLNRTIAEQFTISAEGEYLLFIAY